MVTTTAHTASVGPRGREEADQEDSRFSKRRIVLAPDLRALSRRSSKVDPATIPGRVEKRYTAASTAVTANRERFPALDAAIDRIVWQLVGLAPDGSLPEEEN